MPSLSSVTGTVSGLSKYVLNGIDNMMIAIESSTGFYESIPTIRQQAIIARYKNVLESIVSFLVQEGRSKDEAINLLKNNNIDDSKSFFTQQDMRIGMDAISKHLENAKATSTLGQALDLTHNNKLQNTIDAAVKNLPVDEYMAKTISEIRFRDDYISLFFKYLDYVSIATIFTKEAYDISQKPTLDTIVESSVDIGEFYLIRAAVPAIISLMASAGAHPLVGTLLGTSMGMLYSYTISDGVKESATDTISDVLLLGHLESHDQAAL